MKVTVKLGAPLSQVVGEAKVSLSFEDGVTAAGVLDVLRERYPDFEAGLRGKGLRPPFGDGAYGRVVYTLFVNARPVPLDEAATVRLRDGDRLYLFLPVAGG
ncbi:MAG: MoaD/ThiS family protein [Anaerolineae bacterium]